jgi:hypothetical protein
MTKDQKKRLEQLRTQVFEREELLRKSRLLQNQYKESEGDSKMCAAEELLGVLDRLIEIEERKESHLVFLEYFLLSVLKAASGAVQLKDCTVALRKELKILQVYLESAIEDLRSVSDPPAMLSLCLRLVEIGKRLPILSGLTGQEYGEAELLPFSKHTDIQAILHSRKCGVGPRHRAIDEREKKLKLIEPLIMELQSLRFSGRFRNVQAAVNYLLTQDRYQHLAELIYSDTPQISYEKFLIKVAKKAWRSAVHTQN